MCSSPTPAPARPVHADPACARGASVPGLRWGRQVTAERPDTVIAVICGALYRADQLCKLRLDEYKRMVAKCGRLARVAPLFPRRARCLKGR